MSKSMQLTLRPGEKIFINGAVLRVDRKVTLELLNDATFLLESHVLQVEETTTPLRQLYFVVQAILIDPRNAEAARALFHRQWASLTQTFKNPDILAGLETVSQQVVGNRTFDALRSLRGLFPIEDAILNGASVKAA
ncbi:flagellar biosynthesis repressor FlbT [Xanthobacteraceae bacterium A53D]